MTESEPLPDSGGRPDTGADRAALDAVLPEDLAGRDAFLDAAALHLSLLREKNRSLNLTRIIEPEEAAVKHVLDSLLGLPHLGSARSVLDLGTGAGFPGVPLALARPDLKVYLVESTRKKAVALQEFVDQLGLGEDRVCVHPVRAEQLLREMPVDLVVARAAGSASTLLKLLGPVRRAWRRCLMYKGPNVHEERDEARSEATRLGLSCELHEAVSLPDDRGTRCFLHYSR